MGGPYTKCPKPHIPIYQSATCDHLDKCLQMDSASLYISVRGWGEDCYIVLFMRCLFTCRHHCNGVWVKTRGELVKVANCSLQGPVATSIRSSNSNKPFVKKTAPAPLHPYTVCKQHSFLCNFLCLMSLHSPSLQCDNFSSTFTTES